MPIAAPLLLAVRLGLAAPPTCEGLAPEARARADALLASAWLHDCCDRSMAACLDVATPSRLAGRMAENVCRRVGAGQSDEAIRQVLAARAAQAWPAGPPAAVDLAGWPVAGDPAAPVTVVAYASPRGFHCARLVPGVHAAVTGGVLRGRVRLVLKPFPLRSTEGDADAAAVLVAASRLGSSDAAWTLALLGWTRFDAFTLEAQRAWAAEAGLDPAAVAVGAADPATLDRLRASKREGVELGVASTPTFLIDGHPYRGEMELPEILDTLEEAAERATGTVCAGAAQ